MSVTIQDAALQRQKDTNRLGVNPACTFQCLKAESDTVYTPPTLQQDDGTLPFYGALLSIGVN